MDLVKGDEFQLWELTTTVKYAIKILRSRPKMFFLISLCFILPLSLIMLGHSLAIQPLITNYTSKKANSFMSNYSPLILIFACHFAYMLITFIFYLFCMAVVVFAVASLYISYPTTFSTILSAVPRVISRLFLTFLWFSLVLLLFNLALYLIFPVVSMLVSNSKVNKVLKIIVVVVVVVIFSATYVCVTIVWQFSSAVSVLEPFGGRAAMKRCVLLLKAKIFQELGIVGVYLIVSQVISMAFDYLVGIGDFKFQIPIWARILLVPVVVGLQIVVVLLGMLIQSLYYYICKSYRYENIDKNALAILLGGYVRPTSKLNCLI